VLVIVMWVAFGLVSIALYFAHSMQLELRGADNRVADAEADQAVLGAIRYVQHFLAAPETPGQPPSEDLYQREAGAIGDAQFWLIGRTNTTDTITEPHFGLVDEASKLNLNTATLEMLEALPRMTPDLAAAIIDWRDADSKVTPGGAEDETYLRKNPPYRCKNAPFESVDELRLVEGATPDILFGEDLNRNGVLDDNENTGTASNTATTGLPAAGNADGRLDPGITEYVTVWSREPNTRTNGQPKIDLPRRGQQQLPPLLQQKFGTDRANRILGAIGNNWNFTSLLQFYFRSRMNADEFAQIAPEITTTNGTFITGRVNVNTASAAVLACIPGIGTDFASSLISYRQSNPTKLGSIAWVTEVLERRNAEQAGPFITTESWQFTADIAAVGHFGRGYKRVRAVFDTSETNSDGTPKILYRQDLTHLGWALGKDTRNNLIAANTSR
jgi:type II secretory pathway component PulK